MSAKIHVNMHAYSKVGRFFSPVNEVKDNEIGHFKGQHP